METEEKNHNKYEEGQTGKKRESPWKKLKTFDFWIKVIGAIGSLGAAVAIIFLWCNLSEIQKQTIQQRNEFDSTMGVFRKQLQLDSLALFLQGEELDSSWVAFQEQQVLSRASLVEMQRQTELENRGFLAIALDSFQIRHIPRNELIIYFKYYEASRVPVLIKPPRLALVSGSRNIDFNAFCVWSGEDWEEEGFEGSLTSTNIYEIQRHMGIGIPNSLIERITSLIESSPDSVINSQENMFLHVIFRYEDITEKNYWVYMRWNLIFTVTGHSGMAVGLTNFQRIDEDYVIWEGDKDDLVPDTLNLPHKFYGITKKARAGIISK